MSHQSKILVVDDDKLIREMVTCWLRYAGHEVVSASNAFDGLDILAEHTPDLVVTDLSMPGMNGLEFCKHVRRNSNVPIIVFSSSHEMKEKDASLEAGADEYLVKTTSMTTFLDHVSRLCHNGARI